MEHHVGSGPVRPTAFIHGIATSDSYSEPPLSGFLNRKCVTEPGGKKSKDRSWQTFWCQLKGVSLEFHTVDGVKSEGFKPPPRDIFPPPNMRQHKAGFTSVTGATAEDDYTSQIGKDLQKRRSWLFELTLPNQMVYLLQAPNGTQRAQWIQHIRWAATGKGEDVESRKLKAARCSVRHRSRQNVLSLKGGQGVQVEGEEADVLRGNTCPHLLREMLRVKRDLLAQMNRMCNAFLGDSQQLYSEEVGRTSVVSESLTTPSHRLSLHSPVLSSVLPPQHDPRRASTGALSTTSTPGIHTRLLKDYTLVPGAKWSRVKEGDEIVLTGRLANGWFRCLAKTDVTVTTEQDLDDIFSVYSHTSDDNNNSLSASGLPNTPSHQPERTDTPSPTPRTTGPNEVATEDEDTCSVPSHDQTSESHDPNNEQKQEKSPHSMRVGRSYSYIAATQTSPENSLLGVRNPRRSLDFSVIRRRIEERSSQLVEENHDYNVALEKLLSKITESQSHSYRFPLVGAVPPSVVKKVPEMSDLMLVTPPVPLSQSLSQPISRVAELASSPAHSDNHRQSFEAYQQENPDIATTTHLQRPDTPTRSGLDSSPSTPLHTRVLSPVPTLPSANPSNVEVSPSKLPNSPSKSPQASRRSYEPVAAMLDNTFIKKLLPRKKPSKQNSVPDKLPTSISPTVEEEVPYSSSPSPVPPYPPTSPLPPPALLEFSEHALQEDMRTRMSSVSGRPIKSTGICLQFGEDDSSSDSDHESSTESDVPERLSLSQSLPSTDVCACGSLNSSSIVTSSLLHPPSVSPDIMAPGNLRRAASLNMKVEDEEPASITPECRSKSGSTHSLTSPITRGLHSSSYEDGQVPVKKRGSSKKKRQRSQCEEVELESPKFRVMFRQPPSGEKRVVYLDPRQPKHGFRLESYSRPSGVGQVLVQSVSPGSPAFISGLFPGDTILQLNGVDVRSEPLAAVVKKIQDYPRKSDKRVQLTVMFVDGVTRLEKMKKTEHLRYQMKMKQAQLRVMVSEESTHLSVKTLHTTRNIKLASDLEPWCTQTPSTGPTSLFYPFCRVLNEQVALSSVNPSELGSDVLVIPLCLDVRRDSNNVLTQMVMNGGSDLVDELCLAAYCPLGECIVTKGYHLAAHTVFHCLLDDLEENLQRCMWYALDNCYTKQRATVVFWLDGFAVVNVSPHSVIECVRQWLQLRGNSGKYIRIIFSATTNPDYTKTLVEQYFPLAPYYFSSGGMKDENSTSGEESEIEDSKVSGEDLQQATSSERTPSQANFSDIQAYSSSPSKHTLNVHRVESDV